MIPFIIGIASIGMYFIYDRVRPRTRNKKVDAVEFKTPIILGDNMVNGTPEVIVKGGLRLYKFKCRIRPNVAVLESNGVVQAHVMKTPKEFAVREFLVGTSSSDNKIQWVWLGDQYHCDKHPDSKCLNIGDAMGEVISKESIETLTSYISTYYLSDPMSNAHWDNDTFYKENKLLMFE